MIFLLLVIKYKYVESDIIQVKMFDEGYRQLSCIWSFNGEWQTLIPFLFFYHKSIDFVRLWAPTEIAFGPSDNRRYDEDQVGASTKKQEAVAVDFTFPIDGYNPDKPVFLITHGLNGGSNEPYVKDFIHMAVNNGSTVCVMIARGLMNTPTVSDSIFNGARLNDLHNAATLTRKALSPNTKLVGVVCILNRSGALYLFN